MLQSVMISNHWLGSEICDPNVTAQHWSSFSDLSPFLHDHETKYYTSSRRLCRSLTSASCHASTDIQVVRHEWAKRYPRNCPQWRKYNISKECNLFTTAIPTITFVNVGSTERTLTALPGNDSVSDDFETLDCFFGSWPDLPERGFHTWQVTVSYFLAEVVSKGLLLSLKVL